MEYIGRYHVLQQIRDLLHDHPRKIEHGLNYDWEV